MQFLRLEKTRSGGYRCFEQSPLGERKDGSGFGYGPAGAILEFMKKENGLDLPFASFEKLVETTEKLDPEASDYERKIARAFCAHDIDLRFLEKSGDTTCWAVDSMTFDLVPWDEETDRGQRLRISLYPLNDSSMEIVSRTVPGPGMPESGRAAVVLENQGDGPGAPTGFALRFHPVEMGGYPFYDEKKAGCMDEAQLSVFTDPEKRELILNLDDAEFFKIDGGVQHIGSEDVYPKAYDAGGPK